jgi:hypothetical protein
MRESPPHLEEACTCGAVDNDAEEQEDQHLSATEL